MSQQQQTQEKPAAASDEMRRQAALPEGGAPRGSSSAEQALNETIDNRKDLAGKTLPEYKPQMTGLIDLTGPEHLAEKGRAQLYLLRENLRQDTLQRDFPVELEVITNDLVDTMAIADVVHEISELLRKQTREGNYIQLNQKNKEILLTEADLNNGFERLNSVIAYLTHESTPKNLSGHLNFRVGPSREELADGETLSKDDAERIQAETLQIFKEASGHLHEINVLTKKFTNLKLTVKTIEGTPLEARKELERHYRLNARYADGFFRLRAGSISDDLKDLHILLREASKDPLKFDKKINVYFPKEGLTDADCEAIASHFKHFEEKYPQTYAIKSGKRLFTSLKSPLRKHAFAHVLHLGLAHEDEDRLLSQIKRIRDELYDRYSGKSTETGRILIKVHNNVALSFHVKKALAELRDYDFWLQDQQEKGTSEYEAISSNNPAPYRDDFFEVENKRALPLPGTGLLQLREASYQGTASLITSSWSLIGSIPVVGSLSRGSVSLARKAFSRLTPARFGWFRFPVIAP